MKNTILFCVLISIGTSPVFGQSKEVRFLIDTTITIMKNNSANRDKVDWKKIEATASQKWLEKKMLINSDQYSECCFNLSMTFMEIFPFMTARTDGIAPKQNILTL